MLRCVKKLCIDTFTIKLTKKNSRKKKLLDFKSRMK